MQGKNLLRDPLPFRKPMSRHGGLWKQRRGGGSFLLSSHEDIVDGRWSQRQDQSSPALPWEGLCLVRFCTRHRLAATSAHGLFHRVQRMGTQLVPATEGSAACRQQGDTYFLYLLFAWASDGAEQKGAQTQGLPRGPDQISRSLAAARRRGLRNALPVCWGSWPLVQQGPSWRQEARMTEASSREPYPSRHAWYHCKTAGPNAGSGTNEH